MSDNNCFNCGSANNDLSTNQNISDTITQEILFGIQQYRQNNNYRYFIRTEEQTEWHKRELNYIFEEAASVSRLKQELVRNIAHEIRTPLSSLQLVAEGLEDGIFSADDSSTVEKILDSVNRLNTTVKMMSAYVSGEMDSLESETSDLAKCLLAVYAKTLSSAKERGIELSIEEMDSIVDNTIPVKISSSSLNYILEAIVSNAFEHAHGMKNLIFSLKSDFNEMLNKKMVKVSIIDDGCGVPADMAYKMCEPFWKADDSHTIKQEGTISPGLGLSIVKEMIMKIGGDFHIKCQENNGTCVSVWLPV